MLPFAGAWQFDTEQTLAAQEAAGVSEEQIAQMRSILENPQFALLHPDLTFDGPVATGAGLLSCEYRFFGMHTHDGKLCGMAWHHEDRHDPGDMSKCYIRLSIVDNNLHMEVKMLEGLPNLNDPDLVEPSLTGDVANCQAEKIPGTWMLCVFTRS